MVDQQMKESHVYPIITLPDGQFTIIDGFLIKLNIKKRDVDIIKDVEFVDCEETPFFDGYKEYNTITKLEKAGLNFFITRHELFFRLMGIKEYVSFAKCKGKYYCRRCDKRRATHVAFTVHPTNRKEHNRSIYIVFDKVIRDPHYGVDLLYAQQEHLINMKGENHKREMKNWSPGSYETLGCHNVVYCTEDELEYRIRVIRANTQKVNNTYLSKFEYFPLIPLQEFCEQLRHHSETNSLWKLKSILDFVKSTKELEISSFQFNLIYREGAKQITRNLKLAKEKLFPLLSENPKSPSGLSKTSTESNNTGCDISSSKAFSEVRYLPLYYTRETNVLEEDKKLTKLLKSINNPPLRPLLKEISVFCTYSTQCKIYIENYFKIKQRVEKKSSS